MKLRRQFFVGFLLASLIPVLGAVTVVTFLLDGLNKRSASDKIKNIEESIQRAVQVKEKNLLHIAETLVSKRHPYVGGVFDSIRATGSLNDTLFDDVGRYWLKGFDLDVLALVDENGQVLDAPFNNSLKKTTWNTVNYNEYVYRTVPVKRKDSWVDVPMVVYGKKIEQHGVVGAVWVGQEVSLNWFESIENDSSVDLKLSGNLFSTPHAKNTQEESMNHRVVSFSKSDDTSAKVEFNVDTGLLSIIKRIKTTGFWVGGLAICFALLLALWVSKRLTRALSRLVMGAKHVAMGKKGVRISVDGGDELATLGHAFNQMSEDLEKNERRLVQSERVAAWQDIAKRLAHEIKNPLTPIKLSIETMKKCHEIDHPDFNDYFNEGTVTVLQEVERLGGIVNEFSQFAKLPDLKIEKQNALDCLKSVLNRYGEKLDAQIINEVDSPWVVADEDAMIQIFLNLVENAIAATEEKVTRLEIEVRRNQKTMEIRFRDFGKGLSEESLKKCFTPYFTTKHAQGGSGLGLAITHRLMTEQGGGISVENHSDGGAQFSLQFSVLRDS